jgi:DNA polymerase-3 subunit beta
MKPVTNSEMMPIGSFARRSSLTASALRFYADAGLLMPAHVDPVSGYRLYREDQLDRAVLLRRLREIGMPLTTVKTSLDAEADDLARMVDEHVDTVIDDAAEARRMAAIIKSSMPSIHLATISGPVLTAAIEQVLTATTNEPGLAVLNGLQLEIDSGAATLTATDRYRLSTRSLALTAPSVDTWSGIVDADDLRSCLGDLRRTRSVRIDATDQAIHFLSAERDDRHCRLLTESFPDYRLMLADLPPVTTRVEVRKGSLQRALEECAADEVVLRVGDNDVTVMGSNPDGRAAITAQVTGPAIDIRFEMTTFYPAVTTAIGADLLLDLRAPDLPVTIRSADHGDLTTLAMPIRADSENNR